jgi:UDP-N-acetylmuramoylalanine--D-glutamate ligase
VSITGSNGKSTATALLSHMFATAGVDAAAAGNIGDPLTLVGPDLSPAGVAVVEVSSFQIEDLLDYRSRAAVLLNVSPDHLDRHGTLDAYRAIKAQLLDRVDDDGLRVVAADDPGVAEVWRSLRTSPGAPLAGFALEAGPGVDAHRQDATLVVELGGREVVGSVDEMTIDGPHNVRNALAAALVARWWGIEPAAIATALRTFRPLPHRLERVGRMGGVVYVNDSKATNLDALRMALQTFADPVVLIAGGRDKASPFAELADTVRDRVRALIVIGEAADAIEAAWPEPRAERAGSMDDAVERATRAVGARGVVLLAPGCASFDMFENFEHRGEAFRMAVDALIRSEGRARSRGERP